MKNGINIAAISEFTHEIRTLPEEAELRFDIELNYFLGRTICVETKTLEAGTIRIARDFSFLIHESVNLSSNVCVKPSEYLLAALGGCVLVSYLYGATARGIALKSLQVVTSGEKKTKSTEETHMDIPINMRLSNLLCEISAEGDASTSQLEEVARKAYQFSPNYCTISEKNRINITFIPGRLDSNNSSFNLSQISQFSLIKGTEYYPQEYLKASAKLSWVRGTQVRAEIISGKTEGNSFIIDQPKQMLGIDVAPNPQEYLLASLGADLIQVYLHLASIKKIAVFNLNIKIICRADLRGFLNIHTEVVPIGVYNIECVITSIDNGNDQDHDEIISKLNQFSSIYKLITEESAILVKFMNRSI